MTQNCVDINPISFSLTETVGNSSEVSIDGVYQSNGGTVTAAGVVNVTGTGTLSPVTDVVLTFLQGTVEVGTITLSCVTDDSTWGFSQLASFDAIDVTITNYSAVLPSIGTLDIVLVINS